MRALAVEVPLFHVSLWPLLFGANADAQQKVCFEIDTVEGPAYVAASSAAESGKLAAVGHRRHFQPASREWKLLDGWAELNGVTYTDARLNTSIAN
jgi:hypothetical protein